LFCCSNFSNRWTIGSSCFRDPTAAQRAIVVINLSGKNLSVVLDRDKRINKNLPSVRENETELNGFYLPSGESSHFVVPPFCYNVSVTQYSEGENGAKKTLTREGFQLATLENKTITYYDGSAQGIVNETLGNGNLGHYAYITNNSSHRLNVRITKTATAYGPSVAEIAAAKQSRLPDTGGEVIKEFNICVGGVWHFKPPVRLYTVRALEPPSLANGAGDDPLVGDNTKVPTIESYVELAESNARSAQTVVFLSNPSRNGNVVAVTYNTNELKMINADIVQTSNDQDS